MKRKKKVLSALALLFVISGCAASNQVATDDMMGAKPSTHNQEKNNNEIKGDDKKTAAPKKENKEDNERKANLNEENSKYNQPEFGPNSVKSYTTREVLGNGSLYDNTERLISEKEIEQIYELEKSTFVFYRNGADLKLSIENDGKWIKKDISIQNQYYIIGKTLVNYDNNKLTTTFVDEQGNVGASKSIFEGEIAIHRKINTNAGEVLLLADTKSNTKTYNMMVNEKGEITKINLDGIYTDTNLIEYIDLDKHLAYYVNDKQNLLIYDYVKNTKVKEMNTDLDVILYILYIGHLKGDSIFVVTQGPKSAATVKRYNSNLEQEGNTVIITTGQPDVVTNGRKQIKFWSSALSEGKEYANGNATNAQVVSAEVVKYK